MKQQVLVIHGGETFKNYEEYFVYLNEKEINLDRLKPRKDWKDSLVSELGENFEVLIPRMPNGSNAQYKEWKIWFERVILLLSDGLILIGHSLGGIFLAKYLSENEVPQKIKGTILISAPFDTEGSDESLGDFNLPPSLLKFAEQGGKIYIIQSEDDPVVPFAQHDKYGLALPNAKTVIFKDRGHFLQETFPEIVELIKSM